MASIIQRNELQRAPTRTDQQEVENREWRQNQLRPNGGLAGIRIGRKPNTRVGRLISVNDPYAHQPAPQPITVRVCLEKWLKREQICEPRSIALFAGLHARCCPPSHVRSPCLLRALLDLWLQCAHEVAPPVRPPVCPPLRRGTAAGVRSRFPVFWPGWPHLSLSFRSLVHLLF